MLEPQIVFCKNNHIYDKSLDEECPYCKQIEERRKRLTVKVSEARYPTLQDSEEAFTELSDEEATEYSDKMPGDDLETELGDSAAEDMDSETEFDDSVTEYEDLETEYHDSRGGTIETVPDTWGRISKPTHSAAGTSSAGEERGAFRQQQEPKGEVIGWLVCVESKSDYGETFQLRNSSNYILFDSLGKLSIHQSLNSGDCPYAKIYRDPSTLRFQIEKCAVSGVRVNEQDMTNKMTLKPYSDIVFPHAKVMFYPLVGLYGFEWRRR